jgi:hypothetical protein
MKNENQIISGGPFVHDIKTILDKHESKPFAAWSSIGYKSSEFLTKSNRERRGRNTALI